MNRVAVQKSVDSKPSQLKLKYTEVEYSILSKLDGKNLKKARREAMTKGVTLKCAPKGFDRRYYRLEMYEDQKLARWEEVEDAIRRLLSLADRNQRRWSPQDKRRAQNLVHLIDDALLT